MKLNSGISLLLSLAFSSFSFPDQAGAQQSYGWRVFNDQGIRAMRQGKLDEAERLFNEAINTAQDMDDKKTAAVNLSVVYRNQGKESEAESIEKKISEYSKTKANADSKQQETLRGSVKSDDIHAQIRQLDKEIESADQKGNLDLLQELFKRKADAIKIRDGEENMEYAYCLHFRAQVLSHMHRNAEAQAVEAHARKLRSAIAALEKSGGPAAPEIPRSQLKEMNFKFEGSTAASEAKKRLEEQEVENQDKQENALLQRRQKQSAAGPGASPNTTADNLRKQMEKAIEYRNQNKNSNKQDPGDQSNGSGNTNASDGQNQQN